MGGRGDLSHRGEGVACESPVRRDPVSCILVSLRGAWHVAIAQGVILGQVNTASWSLFLVLGQRYPHLLCTWALLK